MAVPVKSIIGRIAAKDGVLSRALGSYREAVKPVRLGFVIDATASRADTWEQAQAVQRRMFEATARLRRLAVRLVHYGGDDLVDHGWFSSARDLAAAMAPVRCVQGGTQILPALRAFLDADPAERPQAVILIGDCFEEDVAAAGRIAGELRAAGIRVHALHEGDDALGRHVFRELADGTGGRFFRFGAALPLGELCEALAVLAAGGETAVARLADNRAARLLLTGPANGKRSAR